jgi:branched-chain amino acid transport system ATP-binding protein
MADAAPQTAPPGTGVPALAVDGLVAGYGGGDVLHEVSFGVAEGGITCIVGPNGCGKSTLLAVISGLLRPRKGAITFRGQSLVGKTPRQVLQAGLVHVPQNHSLFREMTVRENIDLGGYLLADRAKIARSRARVEEIFPQVAGWADQKAGSLSGGQQRLVEFARCLMLDPALVILDEPSVGLAPKVFKTVFDAIALMNASGKTILLVEQNARAGLRLSSHGVVMENGRIRLTGTGREVLDHPEIGALYLGGAATTTDVADVAEYGRRTGPDQPAVADQRGGPDGGAGPEPL